MRAKEFITEVAPLGYAAAVLVMRIATMAEKIFKGEKFLRVSQPLQREANYLQRIKDRYADGKNINLNRQQSKEIGEKVNDIRISQNKIDKLEAERRVGERINERDLNAAYARRDAAQRRIIEIVEQAPKVESVGEAWSEKYKRSINCNNPKGFSQKAHCAGRKKNESFKLADMDPIRPHDAVMYKAPHMKGPNSKMITIGYGGTLGRQMIPFWKTDIGWETDEERYGFGAEEEFMYYLEKGDYEDLTSENFADGKVKGKSRPGRVKRSGASCKGSVTSLRKKAAKYSGERGKMYHWCANMKSGRSK